MAKFMELSRQTEAFFLRKKLLASYQKPEQLLNDVRIVWLGRLSFIKLKNHQHDQTCNYYSWLHIMGFIVVMAGMHVCSFVWDFMTQSTLLNIYSVPCSAQTPFWECIFHNYLSLVTKKPVLGVCDQGRLKLACSATENGWTLNFVHSNYSYYTI